MDGKSLEEVLPVSGQRFVTLNVYRYNPDVDDKPRYQTYKVPYTRGMVVLDALNYIYENIDSTLAYRWNCRTGQCGGCAVTINGKPGLACRTILEPEQTYSIGPLARFQVIRDLVVDFNRGVRRLEKIRPYVERVKPPPRPEKMSREEVAEAMELKSCIECFSCVAACPSVVETWQEFIGPIGIGKLARLQYDPRDVGDRVKLAFINGVYDCTTCGACKEVCTPRHIDIRRKAIERLRALAVDQGFGPMPGHVEFINNAKNTGYTIEVKTTPFVESVPEVIDVDNPVDEVFFFPGCLINLRLQGVGMNVLEVLKRNHVRVHIPKEFVCCGSVMFRSGAREVSKELVLKNVEYFEKLGVKKLVGLCPGCLSTIKQDWPIVLHEIGRGPYSFKAMDINEYLVSDLGINRMNTKDLKPLDITVTYHDPCHLNRHQGISREPRELINLIPGVKFVECDESDRCCGAGGGVRAGVRPLSYVIASRKLDLMKETGANAFVTSCSFCTIQFRDAVSRFGYTEKVYNVTDLLAMSYKGVKP